MAEPDGDVPYRMRFLGTVRQEKVAPALSATAGRRFYHLRRNDAENSFQSGGAHAASYAAFREAGARLQFAGSLQLSAQFGCVSGCDGYRSRRHLLYRTPISLTLKVGLQAVWPRPASLYEGELRSRCILHGTVTGPHTSRVLVLV